MLPITSRRAMHPSGHDWNVGPVVGLEAASKGPFLLTRTFRHPVSPPYQDHDAEDEGDEQPPLLDRLSNLEYCRLLAEGRRSLRRRQRSAARRSPRRPAAQRLDAHQVPTLTGRRSVCLAGWHHIAPASRTLRRAGRRYHVHRANIRLERLQFNTASPRVL